MDQGLSPGSLAIVSISVLGVLAILPRIAGEGPAYQGDPALRRAALRVIDLPPMGPEPACPACSVFRDWDARFAAVQARARRRQARASDGLARPGPDRIAAAQRRRLREAEEHLLAMSMLRRAVARAGADCGQGPICRRKDAPGVDPSDRTCAAEFRPLVDEAARVARLTRRLDGLMEVCLRQGCPVVACDAAQTFDRRLNDLELSVAAITALPAERSGPSKDLLATPLGAETRRLVRSALRVPLAVPALFEGGGRARASPSDSGLVGLADEIARLGHWADDLAARLDAAIDPQPPGRQGLWRVRLLSTRLWRLYEEIRAIVRARALAAVPREPALQEAWDRFAEVLSRLALDALRMEADLKRTPPPGIEGSRVACRRRQGEPNRAMARGLALARARLHRCMVRASCSGGPQGDESGGGTGTDADARPAAPEPSASATSFMDHLAALDLDLQAADASFAGLWVTRPSPVDLQTDFSAYRPGEAVRVLARGDNVCAAEPGAQAIIVGPGPSPRGLETTLSPRARVGRRLGPIRPSEQGLWIEAPNRAGEYALKIFASEARGGLEVASVAFEVEAAPSGCRGFSGTWDSDFGRLSIVVRDGAVRGSYRRARATRSGFLFGRIRGDSLTGVWQSELGRGGTRLELSEDGTRFTGTWSHRTEAVAGTGTWSGRCIGPAGPSPTPAPAPVADQR
ncbi:MAG: hypothetical protein ACFB6R_06055 [Alphaproteobacteria bacterium]